MEILEFLGADFKVVHEFEGWKIGLLRYSERFDSFKQEERHLLTDETFVLLEGEAVLYVDRVPYKMEKGKVYNVVKGEWHNIVVSKITTVMVVENSNTSKENTEKRCV